jgi:hypothetical protein
MKKEIKKIIDSVSQKDLNNTQRVLVRMISAEGEWVSRDTLKIPSASSRLRDLRTSQFGSFKIACATGKELGKKNTRGTFYSLDPKTVTVSRVSKAFKTAVKSAS